MIAATLAASLLLPVGLMATQITISEVAAQREGGRLAITVKGDAMIDPEAATTKLGEGHLYLFIRDARVREANRSWVNGAAEGAEDIRAHRHKQRVELEVPLADSGCQGPVELQTTPEGLRALIDCEEAPRPAAGRVARQQAAARMVARSEARSETGSDGDVEPAPRAASERPISVMRIESGAKRSPPPSLEPGNAPVPTPAAAPLARPSERESAALRATLALEPAGAAPAAREARSDRAPESGKAPPAARPTPTATSTSTPLSVATPAPTPSVAAPAPATMPAAVPPQIPVTPTATTGAASAAVTAPASPTAPQVVSAGGGGGGTGSGVVLAGLALLAIAGVAFYLSRRRSLGIRHIRIIETASLGPKRAIVMARIGDATMILGSSEAGITLLQTLPTPRSDVPSADLSDSLSASFFASVPGSELAAISAAAESLAPAAKIEVGGSPAATAPVHADTDASDDEAQPVGQAGLLARLFRRGTPANDPPPRFEDMLEDSFEDQELRRKLALGIGARVR